MMSGPAGVRLVEVSVPYVAELVDGEKYYMEPKRLDDATDQRRYRHRGPTLRSLVRLAQQCNDAEELGERLRLRYQRQAQRKGTARPGSG